MPGYSGTPLPKKLGIKSGSRTAFVKLPACRMSKQGPFDYVQIFSKSKSELRKQFSLFSPRLVANGMVWVSWPKKSSGVITDLTEDEVRKIGLELGLVDVKVCAVTEVWSGLKFVIRLKDRPRKG
jgi:hypothetical protein